MAFYNETNKKKKTRTERLNEGGWEDEGTRYRNKQLYGNRTDKNAAGHGAPQPAGTPAGYQGHNGQSRGPQTARGSYARPARTGSGQFTPTQPDRRAYGRPAQGSREDNRPAAPDRSTRYGRPAQPERKSFERPSQTDRRPMPRPDKPENRQYRPNDLGSKPIAPPIPQPGKPFSRADNQGRIPSMRAAVTPPHLTAAGIAINNHQADTAASQPDNLLSGRNPIREAIKSGRDIEKLLVARGELSGSAREIIFMAKEAHIIIQEVDRARLDEITPHHQGMLAFASAYHYSTLEDMLREAEEKNEQPFLVILDGITDPHNLGAIIRTASCVGAHGVIIPERRAVGLTLSAVKAASGSIEYIKVAKVTNITRMIEQLKERGIWIFSADQEGTDYRQVDFSGPCALVIGSEGDGISRLVLDHSDHRVSLPMRSQVDSLNASVAAGILLYAIQAKRQ
jgi:23S rRNA (guanosine2251-2'-O)-methyltransferase